MDFHTMKRKQLQALCKQHKIPANLSNAEMVNRLSSLLNAEADEPLVDGAQPCLENRDGEGTSMEEEKIDVGIVKRVKKVKFSPENETFEFVSSDPRAVRIASRRKRSVAVKNRETEKEVNEPETKPEPSRRTTRAKFDVEGVISSRGADEDMAVENETAEVVRSDPKAVQLAARRRKSVALRSRETAEEVNVPETKAETSRRTRSKVAVEEAVSSRDAEDDTEVEKETSEVVRSDTRAVRLAAGRRKPVASKSRETEMEVKDPETKAEPSRRTKSKIDVEGVSSSRGADENMAVEKKIPRKTNTRKRKNDSDDSATALAHGSVEKKLEEKRGEEEEVVNEAKQVTRRSRRKKTENIDSVDENESRAVEKKHDEKRNEEEEAVNETKQDTRRPRRKKTENNDSVEDEDESRRAVEQKLEERRSEEEKAVNETKQDTRRSRRKKTENNDTVVDEDESGLKLQEPTTRRSVRTRNTNQVTDNTSNEMEEQKAEDDTAGSKGARRNQKRGAAVQEVKSLADDEPKLQRIATRNATKGCSVVTDTEQTTLAVEKVNGDAESGNISMETEEPQGENDNAVAKGARRIQKRRALVNEAKASVHQQKPQKRSTRNATKGSSVVPPEMETKENTVGEEKLNGEADVGMAQDMSIDEPSMAGNFKEESKTHCVKKKSITRNRPGVKKQTIKADASSEVSVVSPSSKPPSDVPAALVISPEEEGLQLDKASEMLLETEKINSTKEAEDAPVNPSPAADNPLIKRGSDEMDHDGKTSEDDVQESPVSVVGLKGHDEEKKEDATVHDINRLTHSKRKRSSITGEVNDFSTHEMQRLRFQEDDNHDPFEDTDVDGLLDYKCEFGAGFHDGMPTEMKLLRSEGWNTIATPESTDLDVNSNGPELSSHRTETSHKKQIREANGGCNVAVDLNPQKFELETSMLAEQEVLMVQKSPAVAADQLDGECDETSLALPEANPETQNESPVEDSDLQCYSQMNLTSVEDGSRPLSDSFHNRTISPQEKTPQAEVNSNMILEETEEVKGDSDKPSELVKLEHEEKVVEMSGLDGKSLTTDGQDAVQLLVETDEHEEANKQMLPKLNEEVASQDQSIPVKSEHEEKVTEMSGIDGNSQSTEGQDAVQLLVDTEEHKEVKGQILPKVDEEVVPREQSIQVEDETNHKAETVDAEIDSLVSSADTVAPPFMDEEKLEAAKFSGAFCIDPSLDEEYGSGTSINRTTTCFYDGMKTVEQHQAQYNKGNSSPESPALDMYINGQENFGSTTETCHKMATVEADNGLKVATDTVLVVERSPAAEANQLDGECKESPALTEVDHETENEKPIEESDLRCYSQMKMTNPEDRSRPVPDAFCNMISSPQERMPQAEVNSGMVLEEMDEVKSSNMPLEHEDKIVEMLDTDGIEGQDAVDCLGETDEHVEANEEMLVKMDEEVVVASYDQTSKVEDEANDKAEAVDAEADSIMPPAYTRASPSEDKGKLEVEKFSGDLRIDTSPVEEYGSGRCFNKNAELMDLNNTDKDNFSATVNCFHDGMPTVEQLRDHCNKTNASPESTALDTCTNEQETFSPMAQTCHKMEQTEAEIDCKVAVELGNQKVNLETSIDTENEIESQSCIRTSNRFYILGLMAEESSVVEAGNEESDEDPDLQSCCRQTRRMSPAGRSVQLEPCSSADTMRDMSRAFQENKPNVEGNFGMISETTEAQEIVSEITSGFVKSENDEKVADTFDIFEGQDSVMHFENDKIEEDVVSADQPSKVEEENEKANTLKEKVTVDTEVQFLRTTAGKTAPPLEDEMKPEVRKFTGDFRIDLSSDEGYGSERCSINEDNQLVKPVSGYCEEGRSINRAQSERKRVIFRIASSCRYSPMSDEKMPLVEELSEEKHQGESFLPAGNVCALNNAVQLATEGTDVFQSQISPVSGKEQGRRFDVTPRSEKMLELELVDKSDLKVTSQEEKSWTSDFASLFKTPKVGEDVKMDDQTVGCIEEQSWTSDIASFSKTPKVGQGKKMDDQIVGCLEEKSWTSDIACLFKTPIVGVDKKMDNQSCIESSASQLNYSQELGGQGAAEEIAKHGRNTEEADGRNCSDIQLESDHEITAVFNRCEEIQQNASPGLDENVTESDCVMQRFAKRNKDFTVNPKASQLSPCIFDKRLDSAPCSNFQAGSGSRNMDLDMAGLFVAWNQEPEAPQTLFDQDKISLDKKELNLEDDVSTENDAITEANTSGSSQLDQSNILYDVLNGVENQEEEETVKIDDDHVDDNHVATDAVVPDASNAASKQIPVEETCSMEKTAGKRSEIFDYQLRSTSDEGENQHFISEVRENGIDANISQSSKKLNVSPSSCFTFGSNVGWTSSSTLFQYEQPRTLDDNRDFEFSPWEMEFLSVDHEHKDNSSEKMSVQEAGETNLFPDEKVDAMDGLSVSQEASNKQEIDNGHFTASTMDIKIESSKEEIGGASAWSFMPTAAKSSLDLSGYETASAICVPHEDVKIDVPSKNKPTGQSKDLECENANAKKLCTWGDEKKSTGRRRNVLIYATPGKKINPQSDMKENETPITKGVNATVAPRPSGRKRKALGEL